MVVARAYIGDERPERVERRLGAPVELAAHIFVHHLQRDVPGAFAHNLHVVLPRDFRELPLNFELSELGGIVGVGNRARRRPSPIENATS